MTLAADLPSGHKLNLGCGPVQPGGWINIDGSNRAWLASKLAAVDQLLVRFNLLPPTEFSRETVYLNLLKGLPFSDNAAACIYAGELIEHFEKHAAAQLLAECFRVLTPNGVLRVCVPDGPDFWSKYIRIYEKEMAKPPQQRRAEKLHNHTKLFFDDICTRKLFFKSMGHTHKWQYDEIQLIELFKESCFQQVERMNYHQSRIPEITAVERSDFLIVEGVK